MLRVLLGCVALVLAFQPFAAAAPAEELIFRPFDAAPLDESERRLLQTALAASGDFAGPLDGAWGGPSAAALDAYAAREYASPALNMHAAALVLGFLAEVQENGWDFRHLPELGVSLALPFADLGPAEAEEGGHRRWSLEGSFTVLTHRFGSYQAMTWHDAAASADAGPEAPLTVRAPDLLVTRGELRDGRAFYTRSDRTGGHWATVYLASGPDQAAMLNLAAASIRPGPPLPWDLPDGGRLTWLVAETEAFLEEAERGRPAPLPLPPEQAALPRSGETTGTGFYLGARTIVTAEHVVAACGRITLVDGTELALIASDPELDIAALAAPRPAPRWLSLAAAAPARLGQRVHAAGFPYYSIAGTSLHLTGGNVSALAGIDDDRRFFSFTAPVQPGNSGGPLIDARGNVLGLVVARLSEDFIVEETGSLPQNVNYALAEPELAAFLDRNGARPSPGGLGGFDMDEGAPDGLESAVVPIVCH
jgi:S1-C subfamily serine protease